MADKAITLHEPIESDVEQLTIKFTAGEVVSVVAYAPLRTTPPGAPAGVTATVDRAGLSDDLINDFESLLPKAAAVLRDRNGF